MKLDTLTKIPKVLGVGLATVDGFVIESQFAVGHNAEKSGAMAAQVVKTIKQSLNIEKVSVIFYLQNSVFFIKETDAGIFFVMCQKDANIGLIKIKINKVI